MDYSIKIGGAAGQAPLVKRLGKPVDLDKTVQEFV
jgi:hypothetical protein